MRSRLDLQTKLEEISGTKHVYFMPPPQLKMEYPAIRYRREKIDTKNADNKKYISMTRYNVIVISRRPMDPLVDKIMELPYCTYDRDYESDNLYHVSMTLYF